MISEQSDVQRAALTTLAIFNKMPFYTAEAVSSALEPLRRALEVEFGGWIALDDAIEHAYEEWRRS